MKAPRVLLVDDQRQVSRVLRSSLELSGRDYVISEVTSAEEALTELSRSPVDLLVTDFRLPTMSGLELVEQAQSSHPQLQSILISGSASEEVRLQAEELGVVAFLPKPISSNTFLEIVEAALEVAEEEAAAKSERTRQVLTDRLADLRQQVGAEAVYVLEEDGEPLVHSGDVVGLDLDGTFEALMEAHRASVGVSDTLGTAGQQNFHHFDGVDHKLYLTNLGQSYALVIIHRGEQEAGQLGAVMHYGRRAAETLSAYLEKDEPSVSPDKPTATDREDLVPERSPKDLNPDELEAAAEELDETGADDFWEKASTTSMKPDVDEDSLTYEQARELGLLEDDSS
ncbi:MAG: response regulator [Anaerolineales bacterium]|nr:response regulator [Anaerolineales bacterium]